MVVETAVVEITVEVVTEEDINIFFNHIKKVSMKIDTFFVCSPSALSNEKETEDGIIFID
jgi:hypothetical protein